MVSLTNGAGKMGYLHAKTQLNPTLHHIQMLIQKWIMDLSVRTKTIILLKENMGINLCCLSPGSIS